MVAAAADDDRALVERAVDGDDAALEALLDRYTTRVHGICWRYFGDAADAEDAAQAALIAVYRGLGSFRGGARFSTWVFRVTTNACHDLARRRARRPRSVPLDREPAAEHLPDAAALERLAAAELRPDLVAALAQLDAGQRHAVVLRDVVGVTYEEIARREGIAVGTAKSRVHRAHARLAELLAGNTVAATDVGPGGGAADG